MPAMSIDGLQLHLVEQSLDAHAPLQRDLVQDRRESSDLDGLVIRHGHGMRSWGGASGDHVAASLPLQSISDATQTSQQFVARQITWQFHAASKMRSSSRCSLIRPGFNAASAKWQLTASFTIDSSSSQESPCVAINPSGRRQFAVKPPSSAGRTRKTSSRSFMP